MIVRIFGAVFILLFSVAAYCKDVTVSGSFKFVVPSTMSDAQAREIAEERAIVNALAKEFGTIVSSEEWSEYRESSTDSDVFFWQMADSFVKGEWLSHTEPTQFKKYLLTDGETVIEAFVKGKARKLESAPIRLDTYLTIPRSGIKSNRFRSGSRFNLSFTSPVDGFLAVYLCDTSGQVHRLLPYAQESGSCTPVEAMKQYEFFDSQEGVKEQYTFETEEDAERNIIYVLFSTKNFTRPIDTFNSETNLRQLDYNQFASWVASLRSLDSGFQRILLPAEIQR